MATSRRPHRAYPPLLLTSCLQPSGTALSDLAFWRPSRPRTPLKLCTALGDVHTRGLTEQRARRTAWRVWSSPRPAARYIALGSAPGGSRAVPARGKVQRGPGHRWTSFGGHPRLDGPTGAPKAAAPAFSRRWGLLPRPPRRAGWSTTRRVHRGGSALQGCFGRRAAARGAGRETFRAWDAKKKRDDRALS